MTVTVENNTFTKSDNNYTNGLCHPDDWLTQRGAPVNRPGISGELRCHE